MSSKDQKDRPREQPRIMARAHAPGMMGTVERAKDPRGALRRLLGYLSVYRGRITLAVAFTAFTTILNLASPYLIGVAIDQYIIPRHWDGLVRISLLLAGVYMLAAATDIAVGWVMAAVSQRSLKAMRKDLFEHVQTLSLSFFDRTQSGDLMSRLTNDIDAIGAILSHSVAELTRSTLIIVGVVVAMFILNPWLALASLFVFPLMIGFTAVVGKRARSSFRALQQSMGRLNSVMQETITGQRAVIAFGQQESTNRKFDAANADIRAMGTKAETLAMMVPPLMGILSNANIAIVAGVGSWMAIQGLATIGTISVFIAYSRRFGEPLRNFSNLYNSLQSALAGAERVFEVLDVKPEIEDAPDAVTVERFRGEVEFRDVDFSYVPGVPVIKDMSFRAEPGQRIAIVGPTGAGKTTMVNILSRFYDIEGGSIIVDGRDIREYRKDDLRRQMGAVLQDVFLFSGSVMDNIRYGRINATDEEVMEAARLANADGFIRRLPHGYMTELSERGSNLSQGQRQLLSIARAVVANPSILILDEATSSVDTRTEVQIQLALQRLMEGRTSFVIAHRLSTIRNADIVLVINRGEIVERGTHEELLSARGFYHRLYMSQFKGTNSGPEFERIIDEPVPARPVLGGGSIGMSGPNPRRFMEMAEVFLKAGAVSSNTAKTADELGLPPQFKEMQARVRDSPFIEHNGRYYISEERLRRIREKESM